MSSARTVPSKRVKPKKDRERDLEAMRDIADDVIESDFVPYACLVDPDSIVTKNGELLQIIKITGLGFEASAQGDLRSAIRTAIAQCLPDASYAVWLHTLRRRQSLMPHTHFPDGFSGNLDASWRAQHPSSASFVNELYITIVKAGEPANIKDAPSFFKSLLPKHDMANRNAYLDTALTELSGVTAQMLGGLRPYGARLLTTIERDGVFYGEHLEFLEKLINLEERPIPVPLRDLSQVLTSGDITFGFNAMEVRTAEGKRRFAALMTVKEYKESTLKGIDSFLDIPCEFIASQCFDFIGADAAQEAYQKQARYLTMSGDAELGRWMEIDRLMQTDHVDGKTFGEQQTLLFLIAPSVKQLEINIRMVQKSLAKLGMVVVREDLRMEECYWAQLPGNFPFVSRKHAVDTHHLAGFANVQTQPMGNAAGGPWGVPVSLLTTVQDTPYFFNFHRGESAHSIFVGPPASGHTTTAHFLLAQARKLPLNIWYLDGGGRAAPFVSAMGGTVHEPGTANLQFNPLQLRDSKANRDFLAIWLSTLIDPQARQLNATTLGFFSALVEALMQLPMPQRRLSALLPILREQDAMLAAQFKPWCMGGEYGDLFDMPEDRFAVSKLCAWNLAPYMANLATCLPLAGYMLHRLTASLTGEPTLIVLGEGFRLLSTPLFAARVAGWLDHLTKNNAACMILSSAIEEAALQPFTAAASKKAASIFITPDSAPTADYAMAFGCNESDIAAIAHMNAYKRHVLLKRGEESTMLKLDLSTLGTALPTLSGKLPSAATKTPAQLLEELMGMGEPA